MEQVKEKTDCKEMVSINTEKQEKTKRIKYIDIARGIAILSVIIGHVCSNKNGWVRAMLYSFHLPLFIIVSGMFYREKSFGKL